MEAGGVHKRPFIVNVEGQGRVLVLRYVKLCEVPEARCEAPRTSCVLKVDPPKSPVCDRRPVPLSPTACVRTPPGSPGATPFMPTNMLESLFTRAKTNGEQACRRQ
ncbi:ORF017 DNA-binding phosphoprotein [Bovine papular stomatitis virus]|uniref:ORF017 DNA-binding phosphoprotein n=1 Tax=Bovine papular stomatitis virus TaxID=129727 RepID=Q6TVH1_9POXV|nr:ORF017 DNA-binding phosphoprotein [Bovine papular stomatitis virus]AAR98374.1 ORF017 DNA-binding phosphoprotein [Bovine papular stomatitis virus]